MCLPKQLAQRLFPVSCGAEHKTEESEKILAIEGPSGDGEEKEGEEEKEKEEEKIVSSIVGIVRKVCTKSNT